MLPFQIISYFYYRRSKYFVKNAQLRQDTTKIWNTIDFLLDFDSCVIENHPECTFFQGINPNYDGSPSGGHKNMMAQFCGHEEV